jgi:outer membrane receptor protein involved in Fe transport
MKVVFRITFLSLLFFLYVNLSVAQDTTDVNASRPKKRKNLKQQVMIPQQEGGIKTIMIDGKARLELRREGGTVKPPSYTMETVVVTSERVENKLAFTTTSSSIISSSDIQLLPAGSVSNVLSTLPGFSVFKKDGIGRDIITSTRGFYGGGEAEYLAVYVDGVRLNDLETGLVGWNTIASEDIAKIEVVRGPTSALYGDLGMGGVLNISTKEDKISTGSGSMIIGSFGNRELSLRTSGKVKDVPYRIYINSGANDGFRKHNGWSGTTVSGEITTPLNSTSSLSWTLSNNYSKMEDPGPLTPDSIKIDRLSVNPFFLADLKNERRIHSRVHYSNTLSEKLHITGNMYYTARDADNIQTYLTGLSFWPADTKERLIKNRVFGIDAQGTLEQTIEYIDNKFVFGGELETGNFRSTYFDYDVPNRVRGDWKSNGEGNRTHIGFYVHDEVPIIPTVKLNAGFRFDNFNDSYDVVAIEPAYSAFSPKVGINYLFSTELENDVPVYTGNTYITIARSFKAPTLDQLFDQRFPKVQSPSNPKLLPQNSWNFEIGVYQRGRIIERKMYGELLTSLYSNNVQDEIDFDISTFKYKNLSQTNHTGFEAGFKLHWIPNISAFLNYTYTSVKFNGGFYDEKNLKGVPHSTIVFGGTYKYQNIAGTITLQTFSGRYLDDSNVYYLDGSTELNVRISYKRKNLRGYIDMDNILNAQFNQWGYTLGSQQYLYPHAPSSIRIGVEATIETPWNTQE